MIRYPLMKNNISKNDLKSVIKYLKSNDPVLTQSKKVELFEKQWSRWLGVKYSVFVNSGSSANLLSIATIKHLYGGGEIILPSLTWSSDVSSAIHYDYKMKFVDIELKNLSMNQEQLIKSINKKTKAVFITHAQGFNGLTSKILNVLKEKKIPLIEDVCESHGAQFKKKKLGSFGLMSNFSFYYAHHMSTIEGGMICTNNEEIYEILRMLRSHGMTREMKSTKNKIKFSKKYRDLNDKFIFAMPAYNVRNTEINALIGINQLKRLDKNIKLRNINHRIFLDNINNNIYFTDFDLEGSSNYAFNLIMKKQDKNFVKRLMLKMDKEGIQYRRGSAGGGNQLRQPYLKKFFPRNYFKKFPITDFIHFYGFYIGNYPGMKKKEILNICKIINSVK